MCSSLVLRRLRRRLRLTGTAVVTRRRLRRRRRGGIGSVGRGRVRRARRLSRRRHGHRRTASTGAWRLGRSGRRPSSVAHARRSARRNTLTTVVAVGCIVWSGREVALTRASVTDRSACGSWQERWLRSRSSASSCPRCIARHAVDVGIDRAERGLQAARDGDSPQRSAIARRGEPSLPVRAPRRRRLVDEAVVGAAGRRSAGARAGSLVEGWRRSRASGVGRRAIGRCSIAEGSKRQARPRPCPRHGGSARGGDEGARQRQRCLRSSRVALAARARRPPTRRVHDHCRRRNLRRRHRVRGHRGAPRPARRQRSTPVLRRVRDAVEARDLGGFMGAYGVLSANDGKLTLSKTGRCATSTMRATGRTLTDPAAFPDRFLAHAAEPILAGRHRNERLPDRGRSGAADVAAVGWAATRRCPVPRPGDVGGVDAPDRASDRARLRPAPHCRHRGDVPLARSIHAVPG